MANNNVYKFPLGIPRHELEAQPAPSAIDAFEANQQLIYLQQTFPMLRTAEEKANNVRESAQCLDTMSRFIIASYFKATAPEPTH